MESSPSCNLCGARDHRAVLEKDGAHYVECISCGFIFTHPRPQDSDDFNADIFEQRLTKYVAKNYSAKKQRDYRGDLRKLAPFRESNRLLEVGSNVGAFLHQARLMGWDALGVEPVNACARYGREEKSLDIRSTTLEGAGLPEGVFDVVYSNAVFEHLPNPRTCFQESFRVLRPGGALYIDTVNWDCYTRGYLGAKWKLAKPLEHLSLYTPRTLKRFCEQAGFDVLGITTHGVRFRGNDSPKLRGFARLREELMKLPISMACRFTLKGDSIAVLAQKPIVQKTGRGGRAGAADSEGKQDRH